MKSRHLAFLVLALLATAAVAQFFYYMPLMSDTMITRLGTGAKASGWSSKSSFTWNYALAFGGLSAVFLGLMWWIPKLPDRFINLPNKEHWLAPERRAVTLESMSTHMLWMHNATLAFLLVVFYSIFRANLSATPKLGPGFWIAFAFYMIFVNVWGVALIVKYSSKPKR